MPSQVTLARIVETLEGAAPRAPVQHTERSAFHRSAYGLEPVDQLTHALQAADLARQAGADGELVVACLLHDIGHVWKPNPLAPFPKKEGGTRGAARRGRSATDDRHEAIGAALLRKRVPERVAWLVGAHVTAKRYLCAIEPAYWDGLSRGSKRSLELQGGPLSKKASAEFKSHAWHADAVRLRRWDDEAKDPSRHTPDLIEFIPLLLQYVD